MKGRLFVSAVIVTCGIAAAASADEKVETYIETASTTDTGGAGVEYVVDDDDIQLIKPCGYDEREPVAEGTGGGSSEMTDAEKQWIRDNWGYDPDVAFGVLDDPVSGGANEWIALINANSSVSFEQFKKWYGSITLEGFKRMFNLK